MKIPIARGFSSDLSANYKFKDQRQQKNVHARLLSDANITIVAIFVKHLVLFHLDRINIVPHY